jgi:hypothetical protein
MMGNIHNTDKPFTIAGWSAEVLLVRGEIVYVYPSGKP